MVFSAQKVIVHVQVVQDLSLLTNFLSALLLRQPHTITQHTNAKIAINEQTKKSDSRQHSIEIYIPKGVIIFQESEVRVSEFEGPRPGCHTVEETSHAPL